MTDLPPDALQPEDRAAWRRWLEEHHEQSPGIWLVRYKRQTGKPRIEYDAAVEEALAFGWIDSTARTVDDERSMIRFTPRKPRSGWASSNKKRVERLLAAGLMHPAGLAKVEQAKADGSWKLLDAAENLEIPGDLEAALAAYPHARANFDAFPPQSGRRPSDGYSSPNRPTPARLVSTGRRAAPVKDCASTNEVASNEVRGGAGRRLPPCVCCYASPRRASKRRTP